MGREKLGRGTRLLMLDRSRALNAPTAKVTFCGRHRSHRPNRSHRRLYIYDLETAVRVRCGKLSAKGLSYGSDDHAHILGGLAGFVAANVPVTHVDVSVASGDYLRRAVRVTILIKRHLPLDHVDKDWARVGMPSCGASREIVVDAHHHVEAVFGTRLEPEGKMRIFGVFACFDLEGFERRPADEGGRYAARGRGPSEESGCQPRGSQQ